MKKIFSFLAIITCFVMPATAQQYKLKQSTGMVGMKTETTIYVKGMRKRTEASGMANMPAPPVEILQCDLQRTVKLNDKKKLYYIEPFRTEDDVNDAKAKAAKPAVQTGNQSRKGGTIYNYYNISDTGERKKMYGFTARHIWTTRRMVPSADACMMKDSMLIKTDGWYIDLPEFNCPVNAYGGGMNGGMGKPDCMDRFVTKQTGKGKLGFPLIETTTMTMGGQQSSFTTSMETIELTTAKLDSMLFEIPPGYKQTMNEEDLQEKFSIDDMMKQYGGSGSDAAYNTVTTVASGPKPAGMIRIGVLPAEVGNDLSIAELQQHMAAALNRDGIQGVPIMDKAEAQAKECDFIVSTTFTRIKQASKLGGLLKAVKNADPGASSSYTIDAEVLLTKTSDGTKAAQPQIAGKFEGNMNEAVKKALTAAAGKIITEISD